MRYKSFRIQNFKGIKDTTIDLLGMGGASIFALVGLNESGKTTILEAIHSFSPDDDTGELIGGKDGLTISFNDRVPRHLISQFTGDVSVQATLLLNIQDMENINIGLRSKGIEVNKAKFPKEIVLERHQRFSKGDFEKSYFTMRTIFEVKAGKQKLWRTPTADEHKVIRDLVFSMSPDIAYFPTLVFNFPETVFLTDRGGIVDKFYRDVFQDILDFDGQGHTIEEDIVRRIRSETLTIPWLSFLPNWMQHDDRAKIQHVMDRAGAAVTKLVFGRWNSIFGENTKGKEIAISFDITEGEVADSKGTVTKTQQHDVFIKFQIMDGTRRFNINDRSLGFRWFFAFMLFTQFRVARAKSRPLLFLFDEPASNLHAAAQQRLIDCFPQIVQGDHTLAYSTHSHYMIEPKWLEQTFIVTNRADDPLPSVVDNATLDDESLDIKVESYRSFVNHHPNQTNYFQPILDRLEVLPSRFDMQMASVVLEGKSDYYILRYASALLKKDSLALIPGLGAGTFGALAALNVGWNLKFIFLLDGDKQGRKEKKTYADDFGISLNRLYTLKELAIGVQVIEDLFDDSALEVIRAELAATERPDKSTIRRFCQERLASNRLVDLGQHFSKNATEILEKLTLHLGQICQS